MKESLENMKKKMKETCVLLTLLCSRITGFPAVGVLQRKRRSILHNWVLPSNAKAQDTAFF